MEEFPNFKESSVKKIDRHDPKIMDALKNAPVYKKYGDVTVEFAKGGERVDTVLKDGTKETVNTANAGDAIVTNRGGERHIVEPATFNKRYMAKEGEEGVYTPTGYCKAIDNPYGERITMLASWGEMMNGAADCKLADTYDPETQTLGGEPYIIAFNEFNQTYRPIQEAGK